MEGVRTLLTWLAGLGRQRERQAALSLHAEDDLGGRYLSQFAGSSGQNGNADPSSPGYGDNAELSFRFHPRLNPLARTLTLIFRRGAEQVGVELGLP